MTRDRAERTKRIRRSPALVKLDLPFWAAIVGCVALLACSIMTTSLWIDEGFIAWLVAQPSLGALLHALAGPLPSPADRQYPLYDLWIWAWTRVFGLSEYALRAGNVPFAALYVAALALTSRVVFSRRFAWIPFAFVPFMWFYVNEARSYFMLAAFSAVAVAAMLVGVFGPPRSSARAPWLLFPAVLCAWLTNILAVFLFPGLVIIAALAPKTGAALNWPAWRKPLLVWGLPLVAAAVYYAVTLSGGSGSAEIINNQHRVSSFVGAGQILYEDLGLAGLGPPRNVLRAGPIELTTPQFAPWLAFGLAGIAFACYRALRGPLDRRAIVLVAAWAVSFALAVAASDALHARFLGRHMAAILPLLLFAGIGLFRSPIQVLVLAAVFAVSDLRLSFVPQYWKDDYRSAAQDVVERNALRPGSIDWAADQYTARYYGLTFGNVLKSPDVALPARAQGTFVAELSEPDAETLLRSQLVRGKPVYLALSKPDVYDIRGGWQQVIAQHHAGRVAEYRTFGIYLFDGAQQQNGASLRSRRATRIPSKT